MVIILVLPSLSMAFERLLRNIIYKCFHITLDKQAVSNCMSSFLCSTWSLSLPLSLSLIKITVQIACFSLSFFPFCCLFLFCLFLFCLFLFVCLFDLLVVCFTHYFGYNSGLAVPFVSNTGKEMSLHGKSFETNESACLPRGHFGIPSSEQATSFLLSMPAYHSEVVQSRVYKTAKPDLI